MNIESDSFIRKYCLDKFQSNYRLQSGDTELVVPSIFINDDYKRHMSINLDTGLWRCFKSGETGNFLKLYAVLEDCSYRQAYEKFVFEDFMNKGTFENTREFKEFDPEKVSSNLEEADTFEPIETASVNSEICQHVIESRMLDGFKFYVSTSEKYKNRLIIPFINRNKKLFYFQARAIDDSQKPKYLNCENLKSSQVLYPFDYGSYEPLYITEGVFDCLSLQQIGLNSTTTLSCFTSREQMLQLSQYQGPLVCAFDNDMAGLDGRLKFMELAYWVNRDDLFSVVPPSHLKDWNEVLVKMGPDYLIKACKDTDKLNPMYIEYLKLTYNKG